MPHFALDPCEAVRFCEFMRRCLYHPQKGYYRQPEIRQGPDGDYLTAPTMGPLFARCIANNLAPILKKNPDWQIAELGPGKGDCAIDLIQSLRDHGSIPAQYLMIEESSPMQTYQRQKVLSCLDEQSSMVTWHTKLPKAFKGIVIANEVLDALPVHLLLSDEKNKLHALWVIETQSGLSFDKRPVDPELLTLFSQRKIPLYPNYRYEISTEIPSFLRSLAESMTQGLCLFFDYGYSRRVYYHPDRNQGTLTSFYQHQNTNDILLRPGQQDISVHVDFNCVAESAHQAGLEFIGYSNQERFLLASDLMGLLRHEAQHLSQKDYLIQRKNAHKLISPTEMGELIKVIAFQKNMPSLQLLGFSHGSFGL